MVIVKQKHVQIKIILRIFLKQSVYVASKEEKPLDSKYIIKTNLFKI